MKNHRFVGHQDQEAAVRHEDSPLGWRGWLGESASGLGVLRGFATGADWDQVQAEVNEEMVGQVALVGLPGAGKSTLLAALRQQPLLPEERATGGQPAIAREGFFTLIDLPEVEEEDQAALPVLDEVQSMNLALYVVDGEAGLRPQELRWISRLRCQGAALLPVLSKADCLPDAAEVADGLRRPLALRPVPVSCLAQPDGLAALVQRMLDVQPRLAIPLAREAPLARAIVVQRVLRQSTLVAAMLGAEPIPLLDLPLQVANQLRLALRLGAVYGQPGMDYRSRELLATLGVSLGGRYLMQQALRLIPVLGWGVSALIGAAETWLLGRALASYYAAGLEALSGRELGRELGQGLLERANPAPRVRPYLHLPKRLAKLQENGRDAGVVRRRLSLPFHRSSPVSVAAEESADASTAEFANEV